MDEPPFDFLLKPVLNDGERALILLQMARSAYTIYARESNFEPDWDNLPIAEKNKWGSIVRGSFRVMLSLMGEITGQRDLGCAKGA